VGVGNERGGGHTLGAREGQQARVLAAGKVLEGDDKPTLLRGDQHYLHYIITMLCCRSEWKLDSDCWTDTDYHVVHSDVDA